jgi:hypothetical protein
MPSQTDTTPPIKKQNNDDPGRPPWWIIVGFLTASTLALALYGWSVGSFALLFMELLIGCASMGVGALVGFVFGNPRSGLPQQGKDASGEDETAFNYRPSNTLDQVSDWLTKILIGVGLVQLSQLGGALAAIGRVVEGSMKPPPQGTQVVTQVVVVAFLVVGFLAGFLWTRIYYGPLQTLGDFSVITQLRRIISEYKQRLAEQSETAEKTKLAANALAKGEVATPKDEVVAARALTTATLSEAAQSIVPDVAEWPEDVRQRFEQFQAAPVIYDSDPAGDIFRGAPREAHGRRLEAEILTDLDEALIITTRVRRLRGDPLNDPVTFLLHPTLSKPVDCVRPQRDLAETKFYVGGWITVVAILDKGNTVLAYDLREMPNAPKWFKEN